MTTRNEFSFIISRPGLLNLVSLSLTITALIMLVITMSSNSWMTAYDDGVDYLFGLSELEEADKYTSYSRDYDDTEWQVFDGEDADSAGTVGLIFLWIAIASVIGSLVLLCLNNFGVYRSNHAMIAAFIGGGLAIIGAIVWMIMFPEFKELEEEGLGLGSAFYLTIIGGLASIGSGLCLLKSPQLDEPVWMPILRIVTEPKGGSLGILNWFSLGLVFGAILILLIAMFTSSWMTGSDDDRNLGFGLFEFESSSDAEGKSYTFDLSAPECHEDDECEDASAAGTTGMIFLWIAIAAAIASLVNYVSYSLRSLNNKGTYSSKVGMITAFVSGGLAIIGSIIWLIMFPDYESFGDIDRSLSAGLSFYMAIIGGLACIGAGFCDLMSGRKQSV